MDYSASFTAGGILFNEFESILPIVNEENVVELLNKEIKENHFLKIKTESARIRITTELKKRLQMMDQSFWTHYRQFDKSERKALLFYVCVKSYQLVADFHFKIVAPRFWSFNTNIGYDDFKIYLDELATKDEEVQKWSDSTRKKCITNYVRMLNETGFMLGENLHKPELANHFFCYFIKAQEQWALDIFLLHNREKETIAAYCQ